MCCRREWNHYRKSERMNAHGIFGYCSCARIVLMKMKCFFLWFIEKIARQNINGWNKISSFSSVAHVNSEFLNFPDQHPARFLFFLLPYLPRRCFFCSHFSFLFSFNKIARKCSIRCIIPSEKKINHFFAHSILSFIR